MDSGETNSGLAQVLAEQAAVLSSRQTLSAALLGRNCRFLDRLLLCRLRCQSLSVQFLKLVEIPFKPA